VSGTPSSGHGDMRNCKIGHQLHDAHDQDQLEQLGDQPTISGISEEEIDANLMGTFPASDPPSWTLGVDRHKQLASDRGKE
jgi:hypothetical protein